MWTFLYFYRFYIWWFQVSSIFTKDFHKVEYFQKSNAPGAYLKQWNGRCISIKFLLWNLNYELTTLIINELHFFFLSKTFFQLNVVLFNFSWIELHMLLRCCFNTCQHHHVETLFLFRLLDLSSPRSQALLYSRRPPINLATRTFFLPETLHQLLSTNWIKVNTVVCSAMSLNKIFTVVRWGY